MKKTLCLAMAALTASILASCGGNPGGTDAGFKPALDKDKKSSILVMGDYSNFEALEAEFQRFNEYYPNVTLTYQKKDDYKNMISTVLDGEEAPNIFFSYTWMNDTNKYGSVLSHMENLADPALKLDLNCLRQGLIYKENDGRIPMVPVFARTYGMLVNNDAFEKESLSIPTSWTELLNTSKAFIDKGYDNPLMGYSKTSSSCFMNTVAYPMFVAELAKDPNAMKLANDLDSQAGEYMRPALNAVDQLVKEGIIDLEDCDLIADNYTKVILRFFQGDVPMMICTADTVSGTKKREDSDEYRASKINYSFHPLPVTEKGGYFMDSPSVEFSVNKDCKDLDMTNEFMRFLISDKELNQMAASKRLLTPTKTMSVDPVYSSFSSIPAERTFSPELLGVKDALSTQIRNASFKVGTSFLSIRPSPCMAASNHPRLLLFS